MAGALTDWTRRGLPTTMTTPALLSAAPGPITNRDTAGKQRSDRLVVSETFTQLGGRTLVTRLTPVSACCGFSAHGRAPRAPRRTSPPRCWPRFAEQRVALRKRPRVPTTFVRKYTPRAQRKPPGWLPSRPPGARKTGGGGKPARFCQEETGVLAEHFSSMEQK